MQWSSIGQIVYYLRSMISSCDNWMDNKWKNDTTTAMAFMWYLQKALSYIYIYKKNHLNLKKTCFRRVVKHDLFKFPTLVCPSSKNMLKFFLHHSFNLSTPRANKSQRLLLNDHCSLLWHKTQLDNFHKSSEVYLTDYLKLSNLSRHNL